MGALPAQLDFPEIWNDWSGGFGYPYRQPDNTNSYYAYQDNPNRYHWSENFDARFPHQLVHCQQMQLLPSRYASFNTNVVNLIDVPPADVAASWGGPQFAGAGAGAVYIIVAGNGSGGSVTTRLTPTGLAAAGSAFDFPIITGGNDYGAGRPAIFGSYLYLPLDANNNRIVHDNLSADIPVPGTTPFPARGYTTAGNRLWAYQGAPSGGRAIYAQQIAAGAQGYTLSDWTATLNVGNGQSQINDAVAYKEQVFFGVEDGLYAGDSSGTFVNVLSDLAGHSDSDNCRDLAIHNGQVVAQHVAGIYAFNPTITTVGQVREIGPNLLSNRSPVIGKVRTLEAFGPWLYAGLWTGSQSYLLAGIDEGQGRPYAWHTLNRFPHVARPQRVHIDGITTSSGGLRNVPQRMWAATDPSIGAVGTAPLYWWPIPLLNGDPLGAQTAFSANYVGSARMDLGIVDGRAPATPKLYRSVTIESENLGSPNVYCDVYYTVDQGPRTLLGRAMDSPRSVLYFPSAQGSFTTGYGIELSLESFTQTPAVTPVYRSLVMRSAFRPNSVDLVTAVLDLADGTRDRQGSPMRPGASQLAELRALALQRSAVRLIDLAGATNIVEVLAPVDEAEVYQAGDDNPYVAATVKMAVMTFTTS